MTAKGKSKRKKKRGKSRAQIHFGRWMSYDAAKLTLREYKIQSRDQYWQWHDSEKPKALPKYPNRVYKEKWVNWSDYLGCEKAVFHKYQYTGHDGERRKAIKLRPFYEALRYVHAQNFKGYEEYYQAYLDKKLPDDLVIDPHKRYKEWVSWPHYLGKDVQARIEAARMIPGLLAICIPIDMPGGFLRPLIVKDGWTALRERLTRETLLSPIKLYRWKDEYFPKLNAILSRFGKKKEDNLWLTPNIHEVFYHLDHEFDRFVPSS